MSKNAYLIELPGGPLTQDEVGEVCRVPDAGGLLPYICGLPVPCIVHDVDVEDVDPDAPIGYQLTVAPATPVDEWLAVAEAFGCTPSTRPAFTAAGPAGYVTDAQTAAWLAGGPAPSAWLHAGGCYPASIGWGLAGGAVAAADVLGGLALADHLTAGTPAPGWCAAAAVVAAGSVLGAVVGAGWHALRHRLAARRPMTVVLDGPPACPVCRLGAERPDGACACTVADWPLTGEEIDRFALEVDGAGEHGITVARLAGLAGLSRPLTMRALGALVAAGYAHGHLAPDGAWRYGRTSTSTGGGAR